MAGLSSDCKIAHEAPEQTGWPSSSRSRRENRRYSLVIARRGRGCCGPASPGRGGLQTIDVAETRRQARLHDAGQQVLKDDVDGCRHRYQWRVRKRRQADDQRSAVRAHPAGVLAGNLMIPIEPGYATDGRAEEEVDEVHRE